MLSLALVFAVLGEGVTFAGRWGGRLQGSGTNSMERPGSMAGIFVVDTKDDSGTTVIALRLEALSDHDDDDDDGDDDSDDDNDNDDDSDDDDDDGGGSSSPSTNTADDDDDDNDSDDGDDDDDDNDGDDDDNDSDDDDDDDDNDNDNDDDDDDGDDDDNDNDSDDDDDDGGSSNLVSSVRQGSLLKEVKANPALAKGVEGHIKKAGGARPLGSTPTTTSEETNSTTQSSYPYLTTTSYLLDGRVSEMSSTTQSSYLSGGRVSDPSYFLAELDASGNVEFTFKRKTGATVSTLSTTDPDVSSRRVEDLASGWKGVEAHHDKSNGIFNWDAYADIQGSADSDYIALGSWLFIYKDPESGSFTGSYDLGVAAGGNDPFEKDNLAGLTGAASYRGPATGVYMMKADADADPVFDYFDARADLAVDFGDATVLGSISGTVSLGETDGGVSLPELTLGSADITGGVLGGNFDGDTGGVTGDGVSLSGKWGGKFFGNRASPADHPGSVAGTFGANTADGLQSIVGAFGAKRTPSPVRYGSLLKEVNENTTLAAGAAVRILRAGGARPLGHTPASLEMSSTTQSSNVLGGRVSGPSYFLAELDASGSVEFTFKRKTGATVSTLSTTDPGVSSRGVDDLASGWAGVETHTDTTNGIFNWDAFTDIQGDMDADYLSLGSWLFIYRDPEDGSYTGSYALGVAAGGNDPFDNNNLAGLTGAATYRGPANGLHVSKADTAADPVLDYFDARVNLSVDFGDATALGSISGTITEGRTDGGLTLPTITLGSADITGAALGGNFDGDTGGVTSDGISLSGKWGGKFFGNETDPTAHPGSVAGTFGANTADNLQSIVGAFGAKRTP